ncbi:MAG: asparagine synthase (glutamine-hydrolyzing), partial [Myxococcales bacterium]|nr:asparagine synthase (glutamine-hydrolyzing) [Myxococcales bacterium]
EVYNYVELGEELVARGHRLTTHSDTEVVLHAYLEWGLAFPERLNGMFALAIWDAREKRLVLCRDHMGIKPLYVAKTAEGVVFGSELKALRAIPGVGVELDRLALDEFMTSGYVVHPRTVVKGVEKVAPGTMQIFQRGKEPVERRYWQLAFRPDHRRRVADWCEEIEATFTEAVRMQLRSDVPLGTLLSGGVDSTVIAATMAELRGGAEGIDSYCVGIDVPGARNEFVHARTVAEGLGLTHHELVLSSEQFGDHMLEAATIMGEPLVEPMVGQLLAVCRHARRRLTVMLSGEGADETWFGYPTYRLHNRIERLQKVVPRRVLQLVDRSVHALAARHLLPPKAAKHAATLIEPLERRYLGLSYFDLGLKASIYSPEMRHHLRDHDSREALRRLYEDGVGGPEV